MATGTLQQRLGHKDHGRYWIFDKCGEDDDPTLRVYHRGTARQQWKTADYGPRDVYLTTLLPGFKLPVCPPQ